jgi:dihydroorotate dehydrogenase (fumarate)
MTAESWLMFARDIEKAGADALELNIYKVVSDLMQSSLAVETQIRNIVFELKRHVAMPIAVKLLPFFTAFGHFAHQLDQAGADGLVLFNRFYEPDIDVDAIASHARIDLSDSCELPLRLHWAEILHTRLRASLALTGGVATPTDGVKAILAGATAVQVVSAVLRHGPSYLTSMRDGLSRWLDANALALDDARGRVDGARDPDLAERASYIGTLHAWNRPR